MEDCLDNEVFILQEDDEGNLILDSEVSSENRSGIFDKFGDSILSNDDFDLLWESQPTRDEINSMYNDGEVSENILSKIKEKVKSKKSNS